MGALRSLRFAYAVLDEGHVIRASRSAAGAAARRLHAAHRLALTGTPVSNNVSELWALFDFLMPGYLGDARTFGTETRAPIARALRPGASTAVVEAAAAAARAVHARVLPFVLRRMKADVAPELPPRTIQVRR